MKIFLTIEPGPPKVTHQMHRIAVVNGKPRVYDGPTLAKARSLFISLLDGVSPAHPLEGPIELRVLWWFPVPKGKKTGWKTTKPDTDNLQKLLKDCMTKTGFWHDDAQVCFETVAKLQATARHGVEIEVKEIEGDLV